MRKLYLCHFACTGRHKNKSFFEEFPDLPHSSPHLQFQLPPQGSEFNTPYNLTYTPIHSQSRWSTWRPLTTGAFRVTLHCALTPFRTSLFVLTMVATLGLLCSIATLTPFRTTVTPFRTTLDDSTVVTIPGRSALIHRWENLTATLSWRINWMPWVRCPRRLHRGERRKKEASKRTPTISSSKAWCHHISSALVSKTLLLI